MWRRGSSASLARTPAEGASVGAMFRRSALLATAGLLCACGSSAIGPSSREVTVREYLFGAFGGIALDVRDLCPAGNVERVWVHRRPGDYLASVLSFGFYLPHRVRVECGARR